MGSATPDFLALGILSVDHTRWAWRRHEQRLAWVSESHARLTPAVHVRFVMRCGPSSSVSNTIDRTSEALKRENSTHADMLCFTGVPRDAGRLKGPPLETLAWYAYALGRHSAFIAVMDDDVYLRVADLVHVLSSLPALAGPRIYLGAMAGWSFNETAYAFPRRCFGWGGCNNTLRPFPFATGSCVVLSAALAHHVVSASRDESQRISALHPGHPVFFHDAFIGSVVDRLTPAAHAIDFFNTEQLFIDRDGFYLPPLLAWHNRWKKHCRIRTIGEYYRRASRGEYHRSVSSPTCGAARSLVWRRLTRRFGRVNTSRYRIWKIASFQRPQLTALVGQAARVHGGSCNQTIDLRVHSTLHALNLTAAHEACLREAGSKDDGGHHQEPKAQSQRRRAKLVV